MIPKLALLGILPVLAWCFAVPAQISSASLVKIVGQPYSYDAATTLQWLDPIATRGLSYPTVTGSSLYSVQGWRYATPAQVNAMFASNLPSLTTAMAADANGNPWYGGRITDFYAPPQFDVNGEMEQLIDTLGGRTITFKHSDGVFGILGIYDDIAPCTGIGCLFSHSVAGIGLGRNGNEAQAALAGGAADCCSSNRVGSFLVRSVLSPVPLPPTVLLFGAGLLALVGLGAGVRKLTT